MVDGDYQILVMGYSTWYQKKRMIILGFPFFSMLKKVHNHTEYILCVGSYIGNLIYLPG